MANVKVGANTSEFQKQMKSMVTQLKEVNSEFNLSATRAKLYGTEQDKLKVKQEELASKIKIGNEQIKLQSDYIKRLTDDLSKNRQRNTELHSSIDKVNAELKESISTTGKNSEQTKALKERLDDLKRQLETNERQYETTNNKLEVNKTKLNNMKSAVLENKDALKKLDSQLSTVKLDEFSKKADTVGKKLSGIGKSMMTKVTMPIAGVGVASMKLASDLNENINKVEATFEENSEDILKWSDTTLEAFGLAKGSSLEYASTVGDILKGIGFNKGEISSMSKEIIGLSADIASFKNRAPQEVFDAITASLTGEYEQLKKYGYVINESILNEYAKQKGMKKTTQEMTLQEKALLTLSKIQDYAKDAVGDFAKTNGEASGTAKIFKETVKQLGEVIGKDLLPTFVPVLKSITNIVKGFANMSEGTRTTLLRLAMFSMAIAPVCTALGSLTSFVSGTVRVFSKVSKSVNEAGGVIKMLSSPVGRAILIIGALVTAGIALYQNWDTIKAKCSQAWSSIQNSIQSHGGGIKGFMGMLGDGIKASWNASWNAMDTMTGGKLTAIKNKVSGWGDNIRNFFTNLHFPSLHFPEFNLPHIKLPHFSINGSFSLNPPSIPHVGVQWYWKGGIIDEPTVLGNIGLGDKFNGYGSNAEAIVPLDTMYRNIDSIVSKRVEQTKQTIYVLVDNTIDVNNKVIKAISKETTSRVRKEINKDTQNNFMGRGVLVE